MAPNNPLVPWGNDKTMNLNTLILTNIQSSPYFKVQLFELKTFHEVVDEIYYRVDHLEPWEKGSRKTAGQTGMCGGVRGVGAGGIVSSAYCLLFKLFTLKLTKKQVNNLITHSDSPYIRGLGFMYIRYSQPPNDLWDWYEAYLDDDEEIDVKAGGGHLMTIGEMLRQWLVKLEWYSTLFPRVPVPIQKDIDVKIRSKPVAAYAAFQAYNNEEEGETAYQEPDHIPDEEVTFGEAERAAQAQRVTGKSRYDQSNGSSSRQISSGKRRSPPSRRAPSPRRSPYSRSDDFSRDLERERNRQKREKEKDHKSSKDDRHRSRSHERRRSRSHSRDRQQRSRSHDKKEHRKEKTHKKEKKSHKRSKDKSRDKVKERSRSKEREYSRDRDSYRSREKVGSKDDERYRTKERDRSRDKERDKRY